MGKPPYFLEIHCSSGHAMFPDRYPRPEEAIAIARTLQAEARDDTIYCVSNRDQELVWPPRGTLYPFLQPRYEEKSTTLLPGQGVVGTKGESA